jgi:nicotinate phosphoribosyltransferase
MHSILDDDLYKFTMAQAVAEKYPHAQARYLFINRGAHNFTEDFVERLRSTVSDLKELHLTSDEADFLREACPFLTPVFIDLLKGYRYDLSEVEYYLGNGHQLGVVVKGPWYRTILWEVKLLALISETYFHWHKTDNLATAEEAVTCKGRKLAKRGIKFADFGTRRRYSAAHHDAVVYALKHAAGNNFVGTSNVYLAMKHGLRPIGTQAHEWFMFHGAKYGYRSANRMAMKKWVEVFHGDLGIALSDTYTTDAFFQAFTSKYAKLFDGVRHDSGDPYEFTDKTIAHYKQLGINPMTKTIVFSDGLTPQKAVNISTFCAKEGIKCSFGIGTNLTNDIEGIEPLNIVMKMSHCKPYGTDEWLPVTKLSDIKDKHTGDPEEVELCKQSLRL